jgi:hypothetical protein
VYGPRHEGKDVGMNGDLASLSEQQLRDRARQLDFDAESLLDPTRKRAARANHAEVTEELRRRYEQTHPTKTRINRFFAKLLGADTTKVERHLRSAGRDEI